MRTLKSISDLKNIDFGQSVPNHSLLLLHWFANKIDIDNNNVLSLTFDPNTDFGSHHYGNYEDMLGPPPQGYKYYTVGNLNESTSEELPDYVLNPWVREYKGTNKDRIIFRVQKRNSGVHRIDQVYITQHYKSSTRYNQEHTYRISMKLLQQIRQFSVENQRPLWKLRDQFHSSAHDSQLRDLRKKWGGELACLGLLLLIVKEEGEYSRSRPDNPLLNNLSNNRAQIVQPDYIVDMPHKINNNAFNATNDNLCLTILKALLMIVTVIIVMWILLRKLGG